MSAAWCIKEGNLIYTCKGVYLAPSHENENLDAYRGELMGIIVGIKVALDILNINNTRKRLIRIGCNVPYYLKASQ